MCAGAVRYHGVHPVLDEWGASLFVYGEGYVSLGMHPTPEDAARAYDREVPQTLLRYPT
jgi:hypothetical protein